MSQERDKVFFRNFSLVVGALAVLMVVFIILARVVGIDDTADAERRAPMVAERTAPMGEVETGDSEEAAAGETAMAATGGGQGQKIYDEICVSCHGTGIPGIPQMGDAGAWAPRIEKGVDTLYTNAIEGYTGESGMMMPARGGGDYSDEEVKAAVDYIVENSGGGNGGSSAAVGGEQMAAAGESADGKKIYDDLCVSCHGTGIPGIPQVGDAGAWAPRIEKGVDTLYTNAIEGYTGESGMMMPARGGGDYSDEEVKAAVDYMVENSQ